MNFQVSFLQTIIMVICILVFFLNTSLTAQEQDYQRQFYTWENAAIKDKSNITYEQLYRMFNEWLSVQNISNVRTDFNAFSLNTLLGFIPGTGGISFSRETFLQKRELFGQEFQLFDEYSYHMVDLLSINLVSHALKNIDQNEFNDLSSMHHALDIARDLKKQVNNKILTQYQAQILEMGAFDVLLKIAKKQGNKIITIQELQTQLNEKQAILQKKVVVSNKQIKEKLHAVQQKADFFTMKLLLDEVRVNQEELFGMIELVYQHHLEQLELSKIHDHNDLEYLKDEISKLSKEANKSERTLITLAIKKQVLKKAKVHLNLKDEKEKREEFEKNLLFSEQLLFATTTVIGLKNQDVARKIHIAGINMLKIADNIYKITTSTVAANAIGPYAAIAAACFEIFSTLTSEKQESSTKIILQALVQVSEQIEDLRTQMHERFQRIESILGEMYSHIMMQMKRLTKDIKEIKAQLVDIQKTLDNIQNNLKKIDYKIYSYAFDDARQTFKKLIFECLEAPKDLKNPVIEDKNYKDFLIQFQIFTHIAASSAALNGRLVNIKELPAGKNFEDHIGAYAKASGFDENIFNPLAWSLGLEYAIKFYLSQPTHKNKFFKASFFSKIADLGEITQNFAEHLYNKPDLFNQQLNNYRCHLQDSYGYMDKVRKEVFTNAFQEKYIKHIKKFQQISLERLNGSGYGALADAGMHDKGLLYRLYIKNSSAKGAQKEIDLFEAMLSEPQAYHQIFDPKARIFHKFAVIYPAKDSPRSRTSDILFLYDKEIKVFIPDIFRQAEMLGLGTLRYEYVWKLTDRVPHNMRLFGGMSISVYFTMPDKPEQKIKIAHLDYSIPHDEQVECGIYDGTSWEMMLRTIFRHDENKFEFYAAYANNSEKLYNSYTHGPQSIRLVATSAKCPTASLMITLKNEEKATQDKLAAELKMSIKELAAKDALLNKVFENASAEMTKLFQSGHYQHANSEMEKSAKLLMGFSYFALNSSYLNDGNFRTFLDGVHGLRTQKERQKFNEALVQNPKFFMNLRDYETLELDNLERLEKLFFNDSKESPGLLKIKPEPYLLVKRIQRITNMFLKEKF